MGREGGWGEGLSSRPLDKGGSPKGPGRQFSFKNKGGGLPHPYPGSASGKLGMLSIGFPRN